MVVRQSKVVILTVLVCLGALTTGPIAGQRRLGGSLPGKTGAPDVNPICCGSECC